MNVTFDTAPQGSEAWLEIRRGRITASRFKDARDKTANGMPTAKSLLYAKDTARERFGGTAPPVFVNLAMRTGTEQEPLARAAYEQETGNVVLEAGFAHTDDGRFGCSVDGLVGDAGLIEIKTIISSETLFRAVVDEDYSGYVDQINGALWLLDRQWCDLVLWTPDLPIGALTIVRIARDEVSIQLLADDMLQFDRTVESLFARISRRFGSAPAA